MTACLDQVDGLGDFLELEILIEEDENKENALQQIEISLTGAVKPMAAGAKGLFFGKSKRLAAHRAAKNLHKKTSKWVFVSYYYNRRAGNMQSALCENSRKYARIGKRNCGYWKKES